MSGGFGIQCRAPDREAGGCVGRAREARLFGLDAGIRQTAPALSLQAGGLTAATAPAIAPDEAAANVPPPRIKPG